jgi:1-acyl-sn-glycerol-3-phosphate acyltransferase
MKAKARFLHGVYRIGVRIFLSLRFDFSVWYASPLPKGPKIFCSNHFSSSDAHFVTTLMKDPLHMVIGPGFKVKLLKDYLKWCEQIPAATKEQRKDVVKSAVRYLEIGDSIYIFPEGRLNTQEEMIEFKKGVARIYLEHPSPIIPVGLMAPRRRVRKKAGGQLVKHEMTVVSRNYYANVGEPMFFKNEEELAKTDREAAETAITDKIKAEIAFLIDDIKTNKFWS